MSDSGAGLRRRAMAVALLLFLATASCVQRPTPDVPDDGNTIHKYGELKGPFLLNTGGAPQIYLLLGLNDVFSLGLNDLAVEMRDVGMHAGSLSGTDWTALGQEIIQAHDRGTLKGDLIFVGHSFGGDDAVDLASMLNEKNIPVRLIVLLDSTFPSPIPPNVDRCFQLYKPSWVGDLFPNTFAGNPVVAERGNTHTEIINKVISVESFGLHANQIEHFTLDSDPMIHQAVIEEIQTTEAGG